MGSSLEFFPYGCCPSLQMSSTLMQGMHHCSTRLTGCTVLSHPDKTSWHVTWWSVDWFIRQAEKQASVLATWTQPGRSTMVRCCGTPTSDQLETPTVATRWVITQSFHKLIGKRRRYTKKKKEHPPDEHGPLTSAGAASTKQKLESVSQPPGPASEVACSEFQQAGTGASTSARKACSTPCSSGGWGTRQGGRGGHIPVRDPSPALTRRRRRKARKASLSDQPPWVSTFKIPKNPMHDTSASSRGSTTRKSGPTDPIRVAQMERCPAQQSLGRSPRLARPKAGLWRNLPRQRLLQCRWL